MRIVFVLLAAIFLFSLQIYFRWHVLGIEVGFKFDTLLVIFTAFSLPFVSGLIAVVMISLVVEVYSGVPHFYFVAVNIALLVSIQLVVDRIFTESYVTKSLWVIPFSFLSQILKTLVWAPDSSFWISGHFWIESFLQALFNGLCAFPFFILMDGGSTLWDSLFPRKRAHLTGADLYQVKNPQRKYY